MTPGITSDPNVMHGTPCFAGTRVPAEIFFDYLAKGYPIDYFIVQFPTVTRKQAEEVLRYAKEQAISATSRPSAA